jgi:hypothetical protein
MNKIKTTLELIILKVSGNFWPMSPKKLEPVKVLSPNSPHPAAVNGARNFPPQN